MIIPRDSVKVEMRPEDEEYDEDDVRNLSPRRTSEVTEKLGEDARRHLIEYGYGRLEYVTTCLLTHSADKRNSYRPV